uniref:ATP synthase complex subunit 8 n=1 Tax=Microhyla taraiensis TaxID=1962504 RepID=A0A345WK02_9NEOB|nr:ATP synthase F0 subunit 8 [Microhyla taraiensis]AXJ93408.1 ATP synthase F0 subunit 8 [Microhyla taraiensis]
MPQLIPDPWFFIFLSSWLIIVWLAPQKILSHKTLNEPSSFSSKMVHQHWIWPWS